MSVRRVNKRNEERKEKNNHFISDEKKCLFFLPSCLLDGWEDEKFRISQNTSCSHPTSQSGREERMKQRKEWMNQEINHWRHSSGAERRGNDLITSEDVCPVIQQRLHRVQIAQQGCPVQRSLFFLERLSRGKDNEGEGEG